MSKRIQLHRRVSPDIADADTYNRVLDKFPLNAHGLLAAERAHAIAHARGMRGFGNLGFNSCWLELNGQDITSEAQWAAGRERAHDYEAVHAIVRRLAAEAEEG